MVQWREPMLEQRVARAIADESNDGDHLSLKEIQAKWGSCCSFMRHYGLEPWNTRNFGEALLISRAQKAMADVG